MKAQIKRVIEDGEVEFFDVYLKNTEIKSKNLNNGDMSRTLVQSTWYQNNQPEPLEDALQLFLNNKDVGDIYKTPYMTFEIVSKG